MNTSVISEKLGAVIRDIKDFPKPGILFKDITPVLLDPALCRELVDELYARFSSYKIDAIVGVESRGFIFGMLLAQKFSVPFVPLRKSGKLPYETVNYEYNLEYGTAKVEMHIDALKKGWNVLIHDDLLATGGTAAAAAEIVKKLNGNVIGFAFVIELLFLEGRKKLEKYAGSESNVSLVQY